MKVTCPHCSSKAIITSRENHSDSVADLYCSCTNTKECGATFVFSLAHKHDINPPRRTTAEFAAHLIKNLNKEDQLELLSNL